MLCETPSVATFYFDPADALALPNAPICYWLTRDGIAAFARASKLVDVADSRAGLITGDLARFVRGFWEVGTLSLYYPAANGGGYKRWNGLEHWLVRWDPASREEITNLGSLRSKQYYGRIGWVATQAASGSLGVRVARGAFTGNCIGIFPKRNIDSMDLGICLNSPLATFTLRLSSQKMGFEPKQLNMVPIAAIPVWDNLVAQATKYLSQLRTKADPVEYTFTVRCTPNVGQLARQLTLMKQGV